MKQIVMRAAALRAVGHPVAAGVVSTGAVDPADQLLWTSTTNGVVGWTSTGPVRIADGSRLRAAFWYLGENSSGKAANHPSLAEACYEGVPTAGPAPRAAKTSAPRNFRFCF